MDFKMLEIRQENLAENAALHLDIFNLIYNFEFKTL